MLHLFNTLTRKKEAFRPITSGQVGMYNCGPTLYDHAHIGNLRAFVFADILRRVLEFNNLDVRQIMNITDVGHLQSDADEGEDKMTQALKKTGQPLTLEAMRELADTNTEIFEKDLTKLNIKHPTALPFASDHIPEQIDLIKGLEEKGFAYTTSDGVYFDTEKDPSYGKLRGPQSDESQSRVETNTEKRSPRDFALWKFNNDVGWDSPWGKGFPGWHLECSAMSMKYLGETFDIHTGGVEHIGTHHPNEIAQSENFSGKPFVNVWLHNEHLSVDGEKMAKSTGNAYTLKDVEERGYYPLDLRYFFLGAHYRSRQNFTWMALAGAKNTLQKLQNRVLELPSGDKVAEPKYTQKFKDLVSDDLNTPEGLGLLWEVIKDNSVEDGVKRATILEFDRVFGLGLAELSPTDIPNEIQTLVDQREKARTSLDWDESDRLRKEIKAKGYTIRDTDNGPSVQKI